MSSAWSEYSTMFDSPTFDTTRTVPRVRLNGVQRVLFALLCLYMLLAFRGLFQEVFGSQYDLVHQSVLLTAYAFVALAIGSISRVINDLRQNFMLCVILAYAALSLLWSGNKYATAVALVALAGTTLVGMFMASRYGTRLVRIIFVAVAVYIAFTLPWYIAGVEIATFTADGSRSFRGFADHKNLLGNMNGLALIIGYVLMRSSRIDARRAIPVLMLLATTLVVSRSSNSVLAAAMTIIMYEASVFLFRLKASRVAYLFGMGLFVMIMGGIAFAISKDILALLGENETFSSRTVIWRLVMIHVDRKPLLGEGYGAFWSETSPYIITFAKMFYGSTLRQAHNGVIEIAAQVGFVGVALFFGFVLYTLYLGYTLARAEPEYRPLWFGIWFILFNSMGEAFLFSGNYLFFAFLVASSSIFGRARSSRLAQDAAKAATAGGPAEPWG